jgi:hypothetical protein
MADESTTTVLERAAGEPTAKDAGKKRKKKDEPAVDEYELEFDTPFGKLEFEFEPRSVKERKDEEKRERAALDAAKAEEKARKKAEKQAKRSAKKAAQIVGEARGRGSNLLPILLIFAIVVAAIGIAIWLFGRSPQDEDLDAVPNEFQKEPVGALAEPPPHGGLGRRIGDAIRAGRKASRDAQLEQERKFQDLTGLK